MFAQNEEQDAGILFVFVLYYCSRPRIRGKITAVDSITKALDGTEACCFEGLFRRSEFHTDRVALI